MKLEEAKEILLNVMADEVIGTYCTEIQKTTECSKNCENEDCFLQQAIDTVLQELEHLQKENEELQKENGKLTRARKWFIEHTVGEIATPEMLRKILANEYIHKDKIREMLEDYKKGVDCTYCNNTCSRYILCTNLQDLLKEE